MDGPREYYEISQTQRQIFCNHLCVLLYIKLYIIKQKQTHKYKEQITGYQCGREVGRGKVGHGIKRYKLLRIT